MVVSLPLTEKPGDKIGRYKLLEQIGEGGFGVVYVAEQEVPVRRRVALKVIKMGMDTREVIGRFEAERQALALMDHPNIAKVLDAGATETGRPYFVMELVKGERITEYCDKHNLSTRERLDLFTQICHAIQHAHQKGIIHRDIKPSNILVTLHDSMAVPKVIDFGIAKATEHRLTDKTVYTALEQMIGTPAYMSPEQAEMTGLDIDTRSDIYSLGVLLYELLTGKTPFDGHDLVASGMEAMRKTIREKEPVRPSTRLATLVGEELTTTARRRQTDPPKLIHSVRGDLDWIVMKCLEKDRSRRYATVNGVAADIKRHLANDPIVARPPSQLYRFQKMVSRHKLAVLATAIIILALALGVIGTTLGFLRAEKHRQLAEAAQRQARENFDQARAAVGDVLAVADEDLYDLPGLQPLRVKLLHAAIDRYQPFLKQASTDPALRAELGRLYLRYGFFSREIGADFTNIVTPAYKSALAIQQQLVSEQPGNQSFRADLGWTIVYSKLWHDVSEAKIYQPQAIAIFEGLARENPDDPFARLGLAWALGLNHGMADVDVSEKAAKSERRRELLEQLVQEYPLSAEFRRDLCNQLTYGSPGESASDYLAKVSRANELRTAILKGLEQHDPAILAPAYRKDSEAGLIRPSLVWGKFDLANGWRQQSQALAALKRWPDAVSFADKSIAMARDLSEQNPSLKTFSFILDRCFSNRVEVAEQSGDAAGAQAHRLEADNFWRTHPSINR